MVKDIKVEDFHWAESPLPQSPLSSLPQSPLSNTTSSEVPVERLQYSQIMVNAFEGKTLSLLFAEVYANR